jgi:hypothetical protein
MKPSPSYTRSEVRGVSLGILVSTHPDVMAAFAANDAFQKAEASDPRSYIAASKFSLQAEFQPDKSRRIR